MSSTGYLSLLGAETTLHGAKGWIASPRFKLISGIGIYTTYYGVFLIKLNNGSTNVSSSLCADSCILCFLYIWLSFTNPSFHDAIEEIAHVRPWCFLISRAGPSWSLSRCDLNSPVFSLAVRVLAFLETNEQYLNQFLSDKWTTLESVSKQQMDNTWINF
jgi:hypothetical protein